MNQPAHIKLKWPLSSPWLGLFIVGIFFLDATILTWLKWPDPLVDFGLQLYLPWKISTGDILYHDLHYLTGGPFSQYFNALLFKVFGVSLLTLVIANLLLAAGLLILVYKRFLASTDIYTASLVCLGIVTIFTFGQYSNIGNFNYITPYCHEVWHGLVLSILALVLLENWLKREQPFWIGGAGFCTGLVFMTKPDVFTALLVAVAVAFVLFGVLKRRADFILKSLLVFILAGLLPLLGFALYFHQTEGWRDSWRSVSFAWVPLLESSVSENAFYKWCLGLDAPGLNFRRMIVQFSAVGAIVMVSAFLFRRKLDRSTNRLMAFIWVALILAIASRFDWVDCGRSLPLLSVMLCIILCVNYKKISAHSSPVFPLLWSIFGLMLLAKLGLYSRVWHYGFALAMPAFVSAIYLLFWLLPMLLERYGVHRRIFRITVCLALLIGFARLFVQSQFIYHDKTTVVGSGSDRFLAFNPKANPNGMAIQSALTWMRQNVPADATLAVLPEGIMVNYLARRTNPTHYFVWNPAELAAFGQETMTGDFRQHAPDYVLLIQRDAGEYGANYFGIEEKFGLGVMTWIQKNYETAWLLDAEPLKTSAFGLKILKRNPPAK